MSRFIGVILIVSCFTTLVQGDRPTVERIRRWKNEPRWRLFAVEYARSHAVPEHRLVAQASPGSRVEMSWYFFVAVGHGRIVLIDCGTDAFVGAVHANLRRRWRVVEARRVDEALAHLGVGPADVTDVILTHHHWDHVGGLRDLNKATVYAHPREWVRVAQRLRRPIEQSHRFRPARTIDPAVLPDLDVIETGHHTRHQLSVMLRCRGRTIALLSDAAYTYRNIRELRPVAVTYDRRANRNAIANAVREVGVENVVPGHDPAIFDRYPSPATGVAALCL